MALKMPSTKLPSLKLENIPRPDLKGLSLGGRIKVPKVVKRNIERYLGLVAGFFLFVAPFAVFTSIAYFLVGAEGEANIHSICYKLPLDWLITGSTPTTIGPIAVAFVIGVLVIALVFGPLFCGRLCPVGAISEFVSRIVPLPHRFRMRIRSTRITASLRYGFLAGFVIMGWLASGHIAECTYGVELGRYCSSSLLEFMSLGAFTGAVPANYWNSGLLMTLVVWLFLGGVMMVGGRGWCLFFCPLGAMSGISHAIGSRLGLYRIEHDGSKCRNCRKCEVSCPMWAIDEDRTVEPSLCMGCRECVNNCSFGAYRGNVGRNGLKIRGAVTNLMGRIKATGAFLFATSTAPVAAIIAGPCSSVGCAACPLGGACAVAMPILFGGVLLSRSSGRFRRFLASVRRRLRDRGKD
ncbi:MAG: 4Fe-4S binding protein [Methanomassiliicoccus sp.]|nr:4Fe-4S binding protein [Methanomassiliicoccus sp.]